MQAMLAPQLDPRRAAMGSALGPASMSPGERALVASVLSAGSAAGDLVPALMRAHASADVVVGLDVDRDRFDKFGFRTQARSRGGCGARGRWAVWAAAAAHLRSTAARPPYTRARPSGLVQSTNDCGIPP